MNKPACCQIKPDPAALTPVRVRPDFIFWGGLVAITGFYLLHIAAGGVHDHGNIFAAFAASVFEMMNTMWVGIAAGMVAMGIMSRIPRAFIMAVLGSGKGVQGILRATFAGVLLDLCSHGILMVGAKLYERGATAGQVMAFLISSPWNSLSLTLVLAAMIGWGWTLAFIVLSMVIGIITGVIFDRLVDKGVLPKNPNTTPIDPFFRFWTQARAGMAATKWTPRFIFDTLKIGVVESKMILRWLFVGVIIASLLRVMITPESFATYFGPTMLGLTVTLLAATVIEVCSEGSAPLAADIVNRAGSVGNGFTFLMAGVATDYTEIMVLREATKSWKMALFLPLITVPQVLVIGWLINQF